MNEIRADHEQSGRGAAMDVSLRHVEIFHAVMTTGSLTQAAGILRTSQPTISRELKSLERVLGFTLFERRARRLYATEQAFRLHAEVQRSFNGLQQLVRLAQDIRDDSLAPLELGCLPLFAQTLMPKVCKRLLAEHPEARISYHDMDQAILIPELLAARYEVGIVGTGVAIEGAELQTFPLGNEVCVLPDGHPLCAKDVIAPRDLQNQCLISVPWDDWYRRRFDRVFDEADLWSSVKIEAITAETVCTLVQNGLGVATTNPISAQAYRGRGVQIRRLSVAIPFVIGICRPYSRAATPMGHAFVRHFLDECVAFREALIPEARA
jgi:DNA-binding transcriptional LysR family regulator